MEKRLEDKVAVITGATSGIGERTAEIFVEQGASVVIAGRSSEKGDAIAHRLGENALFVRRDVTQESESNGFGHNRRRSLRERFDLLLK
jgi:NADP-dependent 3-hydroxy acid dehydrogenase YdfG